MNDSFMNQKVEFKTYNSKNITQYPVAVINSKEERLSLKSAEEQFSNCLP